ncbi:MAG: outer membrane protein assembly factor BamA [Bacteroidota bacterium]|nr:outer membrane protein assembly factor BamA [Ignavibacteria bacterium]MCU7500228.1 outer membrane protein assembly factor BamA [Ignavibacteria bacterium]MCU7511601.1 outer membrane protein assembly factor BamA [Ignavibacteria bacterium]MCU7522090.1 outer membrane protein assembly factor BamA [Ignavibacteria bacterium]MCU7525215.1 outer membrane protein assembly factor BamA [Ignavibacteria bacterium]
MTKIRFNTPFLSGLVALFIAFTLTSHAQMNRTQYKVLGISVQGNKSADASTIIANSGLKVGDEIDIPGDQTINAIRHLWSLNIFSDVQILIDKQLENGVFLLIKVAEFPRVEKVVFEGNDDVSEKDIEGKVSFVRGQILKPQDLYNAKTRIQGLYDEEGLLNAKINILRYSFLGADTTDDEIKATWRNNADFSDEYTTTYEIKENPTNLVSKLKERILVKFKIDEGGKVTVREIAFNGNNSLSAGDLKGSFKETSEAKWWKFWSSAKLNKKKFEEDEKLLVDYYKSQGFRDMEILSDSLIFSNGKKDVKILINVAEGPQYKIRNINWDGNTVYKTDVLNDRLGLKKGDLYNYEKFQQNLRGNEKQNDVAALYQDNGYLMSNFRANEIKVGQDSVDLDITVTEGNQFKIGRIDIQGNDKTEDKVVRRELYTIPSNYFSRTAVMTSLQQLANLQYFNVEKLYKEGANPVPVTDSTVNITYSVEEKSSDYLNASIGYSGSFGFSGSVGVTLTNFSLAHPFQMGGGQVLNFNWQFGVGNYYRTFTLGFTEPWLYDSPTLLGFEVFDTRQAYYYDLSQYGGSVRLGRRLTWPDHYFNVQGTFKYQNNDIKNGGGYYKEGKSEQYTIGATISRKDIDNPIFPSQGSSVVLDAELSGGAFLPGDLNYYKTQFKAEWYKRLFNTNRIALYTVADLGYMNEFDQQTREKINPFEKFFMGGNGLVIATTPLRGYDDRTIGPKNILGDNLGGNVMTRYTMELRAALALEPIPIYILGFAEAGNVWANISHDTNLFDLKRSAGVGARILINPIGLIGFDFGYGFDRKSVDGKEPAWLFHFQFGRGF